MIMNDIGLLSLLFFIVAWIYSSVGFGGGSSYMALLILLNVSYKFAPSLALTCNLIVAGGGAYHFFRHKHFFPRLLLPFMVSSIPFAYWGGKIPVEKEVFMLLLGITLLMAGSRMLFFSQDKRTLGKNEILSPTDIPSLKVAIPLGALIGFLSGIVGIGGGIFLAPVLYAFSRAKPKQISAAASVFIFCNSLAGLTGQLQKIHQPSMIYIEYWPLLMAVFLGGQIGGRLGARNFSHNLVAKVTGFLIITVAIRLLA